ncbi:MAG: DUF4419 domain-containing protein [Fibrobacter sp.]|nr:DUF4419 domain-containing protein [Fibrobacter sp.]
MVRRLFICLLLFASAVFSQESFVLIENKDVRDSAFHEKTIPVSQGGFLEYFAEETKNGKNAGDVLVKVYSDSTSPFVEGFSEEPDFLSLVSMAYASHYGMEISPDDIWLMILDGIRIHVKVNRDSLKDKFVGPGADTTVKIQNDNLTFESSPKEWTAVINGLFDGLQEKLPAETGAPLKTRFSTTSNVDFTVSSSMVLAVSSEYYSYHVYTMCGIPKIKIKGTKEDWIKLKEAYNQLAARLDLKWWADELNPVLDEFINVQSGNINLDFWKEIFKRIDPKGCGSPKFNGWISKFFPYTTDFEDNFEKRTSWDKNMEFDAVPKGITDVNIQWHYMGRTVPLKLYTGFIGVQYDKKNEMLKASRGYALVSQCGWCNQEKVAKNLEYIPGKPMRLQEVLAIVDSMNIVGQNGVAYATKDKNDLLEFAATFEYEQEYPDDPYNVRMTLDEQFRKSLSMNFYRKGELIEHTVFYGPVMASLHGFGGFRDTASVQEYLRKKNISTEGVSPELAENKSLPKMEFYVKDFTADKKYLKEAKESHNGIVEYRDAMAKAIEFSCGWRLQQVLQKHYKDGFNLSVEAELSFDKKGKVTKVKLKTKNAPYKKFLDEIKAALYYAYLPSRSRSYIGNDLVLQGFVRTEKVMIFFTQDHRMVCKENGQDAQANVVLKGIKIEEWQKERSEKPCNEIEFSRNVATGGVTSYHCYRYVEKNSGPLPDSISQLPFVKNLLESHKSDEGQENQKRKEFGYYFNQEEFTKDPTRIIIPQIPACFEEVPFEDAFAEQ